MRPKALQCPRCEPGQGQYGLGAYARDVVRVRTGLGAGPWGKAGTRFSEVPPRYRIIKLEISLG